MLRAFAGRSKPQRLLHGHHMEAILYVRPIRFAMSKLKFWRHANMDPEMESQLVPLFTWVGAREGGVADVA